MTLSTEPNKTVSKRKHRNQHNGHKQLRIDTTVSAGYTRPQTHGLGIWKNPRVPMTIRVDKKLKTAFKEASKAFSGSTCSAIEYIMAAYVGAYKSAQINGVYPSLTIGEIKIERNLRERRKLVVETETEATETFTKCCFANCKNEAIMKGFYKPLKAEKPLCESHFRLMCDSNSVDWRFY